ncbi:MAG: 30S ribosomal protein S3 [Patescibacteria group bacterium]|nr:30S ribosomal protein S3 [Patescibacteria group bacterium]MDD5490197.1 30S ribosomal protein S3 [Patescibacteria group bacterium]
MGHKVNPKSLRLGTIYTWNSKWFSDKKNYRKLLRQDVLIRDFLRERLKEASVEDVMIERNPSSITITIFVAKPGIVIGRGGSGIEDLKKELKKKIINKKSIADVGKVVININIKEVKNPNLSAPVVLRSMVADLEKRIPFRRVMKQAIGRVEKAGAIGVKVTVSGRLNGAEIARTETLSVGKIPLHTIRADIDYASDIAQTIYGVIGVKVWICKGEIFNKKIEKR